jgi:undecaprenyl phosphate N,N'-diacetylbacillosamine 1-phosphate transferase
MVVVLPFALLIAVAVSAHFGGNPFFVQLRPGLDETPFRLFKFKTMKDFDGYDVNLESDGDRLTWLGRLLRSLSFDELPQLFNILIGDMSFIGPRPLRIEYLPLYNEMQRFRHTIRPGISGWAQVKGRNSISWQRKFELDVFYVQNLSFMLDLKIAILTVAKVVTREGVEEDGQSAIDSFNGYN